jgi:hypothetical protein
MTERKTDERMPKAYEFLIPIAIILAAILMILLVLIALCSLASLKPPLPLRWRRESKSLRSLSPEVRK